uniref:TIR domain-containing protein n=1 Tax=Salix viminalis TaxID=40686 RepID=A0A6N2LQB2_SALVM
MMMDEFDQRLSSVLQLFSLHAVRRKPCKDYEELQKRERGCGSELVMLDMQGSKVQKLWKGTKGTNVVEGLALDVQGSFNTKSFTKMRRLQLLQITGAHLAGSYSLLPRELIWLCWPECPLKSLPSDFHLSELVILDMQKSKVRKLWKGTKSPFSSMSSSYRHRWNYDVFLSFRGEDTRKTITDHLYSALIQAGIHTFRDDNELPRGEEISPQLLRAIEGSRISVVVFSTNYASSRWCLDELVKIIECRQKTHQAELIKTVVNDIACKLGNKTLHVAKHPVGISSRVQGVISLLRGARNNVGIVGIHGIAGIGKTTIAKAVFNNLYFGFEGSSFLSGVREISDKPNGLVELQERLVNDILKPNVWKISNVYEGMNLIKERLHRKNVLVVFDDVDKREQVEALMGERCWFGDGSILIIVTKNKHLLTEVEVDGMYHAKALDQDQSLQLFSLHAFRETRPAKDYEVLSGMVVDYCKGLPLALKILGSHLSIRDKAGWEIDIAHWQNIPHDDIQGKLRVSFDALDVDSSEIFLDIACFFVGKDKDYVANIVGARYSCHPEVAFRALIGRSLIRINTENKNRLWMHDIVRKMGREIIRQRSRNHPGNCSRIVLPKDAYTVLSKEMGTEAVEGLALDVQGSFSTKSFTKMRRLQLLRITGAHLAGSYSLLPRELIWLCWLGCPLKSLPSDFHLSELVILDMQGSKVRKLWKGTKRLVLLNLKDCNNLKTLPESMGSLKSLQTLNVTRCSQLEKLPDSLGGLESLTELFAKGTAIKQLPTSARYLKKLTKLSFGGYKNVFSSSDPPSKSRFSRFSSWVSPKSCSSSIAMLPASFTTFSSLKELDLSNPGLPDAISSIDLGSLSFLEDLNLSGNGFLNLPSGISRLPKLQCFTVERCKNLLSISELPSSVLFLSINGCTSIQRVSAPLHHERLPLLNVKGCRNLIEIQGMEFAGNNWSILNLDDCNNLSENYKMREEISPQLLRAIEGSRISVVVFSKNYASSRWCLDELVKIIECKQKIDQVVLPIFYDTDPSDVRKQTGSYAKAFDEHEEHFKEEMEKVNRWREALAQAGNLSGWGLNNEANGYEAKLIKTVVNNVACKLGNKTLHVAKHPVGISSRVQRVISLLRGARNNVGIVGIYGIAGIGKTTIAKAVFNNLYCRFEGSSFLSGVREISDKPNGLVELQERLVNDILKPNVWKISNVYEGMNLIKERLHRKNVLVVLDDVDKREQVEALMGERCWFGDGSILIIVTKNKHLLTEVEVDGMYHAKALDQDQSLQLFSLHAFRETRPAKDYEVLSGMVVDYCKGLPLALKILGSHLVGQDKAGWEINIAHWRNIPHDDIQAKLRVSFDALDVDSREIFLDIACFFVGKDKDYVADIVGERYDCHPEVAFRALIGRSLIAINNSLWMHDIVREMGREIIRQRSRNNPGNCSRIVLPKDAHIVLSKEMGTEAVEGLALDIQGSFSTKSFTKMRHLKLLQITGAVHLVGSYSLLPRELIWLYWPKCPLKSLPSDFHLSELVMLDMQGSKVQKLWKGTKPCFVEFGGLQQLKESSRKHGQLKISSNSQRY